MFKFSPLLILDGKGTRIMKELACKIPSNLEIVFSGKERNSFSNYEIFAHWIKIIYLKEMPSELKKHVILFLDNSGTHKQIDQYKKVINYKFFPENTTGILQPMDISVNGPFKQYIRHQWEQWMSNQMKITESGYYTP